MSDLNLKILDDKMDDNRSEMMRDHSYIGTIVLFMVLYRLVWRVFNFAVQFWANRGGGLEFYTSISYSLILFFISAISYIFPVLIALRLKNDNLKGLILALTIIFFMWDLINFVIRQLSLSGSLFQF